MVDVDHRTVGLTPAHAAGLRRLSTRAATSATSSISRNSLFSFSPLAESLLSQLRSAQIPILPGLSPSEFVRAECEFNFHFPPDLRAVLSLGLPSGPAFPDWRSPRSVRHSLDLPIAAISFQIARNSFWPKSWGLHPSDPERALRLARSNLRRAPLLIPLFDRCYIPCRPSLAGNPIFFVDETRISCCGFDLSDFFRRESPFKSPISTDLRLRFDKKPPIPSSFRRSLDSVAGKKPRWIEFWSDAAFDRRRRNSSSSEPESDRFVEIRVPKVPDWVASYLDRIGSVLREGGWGESEVSEMVQVEGSGFFDDGEVVVVDSQAVLDALLLKADRCSDSLRRAGWSSEEVFEALGFEFMPERGRRRPSVKLPAEIAIKIGKLAEAVCPS